MSMNKKDVIQLLETIAVYLELKGENPFKISAYRKASQALEREDRSLSEINDFTAIQGIGKGTATVIDTYIETGQSETLEELKKQVPEGLIPLLQLPGLGGKKLARLYHELSVVDEQSLKSACETGQIQGLKGFGKKSEEKILEALNQANQRPERLPMAMILPVVEKIEAYLATIEEIERFSLAGSMRRYRETIRDIDFIIATNQPETVRDHLLQFEDRVETIASGDTKVSITVQSQYEINVDFRLVQDKEFATTLHHFTGSKDHNVLMRQLAKQQGKKISEYGIEDAETGEVETFASEESFFASLGLHYIPPEVREGKDEVERAIDSIDVVQNKDIRGDLHMHTTWSDGGQSLEEMVQRAIEKNYQFIAITDHSKYLRVANGLNEERLRKQREEINSVQAKYPEIKIFAGIEMDIRPDGSLDFDNDFLPELDFVIASIHSSFQQSQADIHKRLQRALENPYVDLIAHPTGRLIGRRTGYDVDIHWLIEKAKETDTALELNANPNRLDLSSDWVRIAQEKGVPIAINTDAHSYSMLDHMPIGCATARKGWLQKSTVINTWQTDDLMKWLTDRRNLADG
ncbi:hypothetical protein J416_07567 [Gracilibacillus halophilus YIM-C55.5]|uniref:DNA-directed DNA polymerase n=1 Tax=Gracilibacillus halophilus YIM-C55.5 TaxID=1308866 RepID=N4WVE3_9BACI|nr:DNA polymerase/3'-5' exonuclease PolX [Gracilibacillus halophilus]ENH97036.1 hypothetical protein J416_07567 [Gracilibacillus halophilus YIM-C55.5]